MLKILLRHAAPLLGAWLILPTVSQAAEKNAEQSAPPSMPAPFDQYRNFRDEPVTDWRQANERVNEVGGWRTYLRESYQDGSNAGQDRHQH